MNVRAYEIVRVPNSGLRYVLVPDPPITHELGTGITVLELDLQERAKYDGKAHSTHESWVIVPIGVRVGDTPPAGVAEEDGQYMPQRYYMNGAIQYVDPIMESEDLPVNVKPVDPKDADRLGHDLRVGLKGILLTKKAVAKGDQ